MIDNLPPLPAPARRQGQQMSYDGDDTAFFDCYSNSQMQAYARAAIEANTPAAAAGWKLVPVEPTKEMLEAMVSSAWLPGCYRAMLAAAPQPQPVAQPLQASECEWTNCPRRVGDVCCNQQKE